MVKPDEPPGQQKNVNSEECTTCTHARSFHQQKLYYCKASVMTDADPDKPGHGPKIKAPCPCTQFTSNPILKVDKTDHGFSNKPSKDKDKYVRENIDIKPEDPNQSKSDTMMSDPVIDNPAQGQPSDPITG